MKFLKLTVIISITTLLISGCSNDSQSESKIFTFEPKLLDDCSQGHEVTVNWDIKSHYPEVTDIDLYVSDGNKETLFAQGQAIGSAKTGFWTYPGTRFIIKDSKNNKTLEDFAMSGPKCM